MQIFPREIKKKQINIYKIQLQTSKDCKLIKTNNLILHKKTIVQQISLTQQTITKLSNAVRSPIQARRVAK